MVIKEMIKEDPDRGERAARVGMLASPRLENVMSADPAQQTSVCPELKSEAAAPRDSCFADLPMALHLLCAERLVKRVFNEQFSPLLCAALDGLRQRGEIVREPLGALKSRCARRASISSSMTSNFSVRPPQRSRSACRSPRCRCPVHQQRRRPVDEPGARGRPGFFGGLFRHSPPGALRRREEKRACGGISI
jgi:hypothetical protein